MTLKFLNLFFAAAAFLVSQQGYAASLDAPFASQFGQTPLLTSAVGLLNRSAVASVMHPGQTSPICRSPDDAEADGMNVLRLTGSVLTAPWFKLSGQSVESFFSVGGDALGAARFALPVTHAVVTSAFGMRLHPNKGGIRMHTGVDLAATMGAPVTAAAGGTVAFAGFEKAGYGRYVVVQHGGGFSTWYAHLSAFARGIHLGSTVLAGQLLGRVGKTGDATGPHLHFEVRDENLPIDPMSVTNVRSSFELSHVDAARLANQTGAASDPWRQLGLGLDGSPISPTTLAQTSMDHC